MTSNRLRFGQFKILILSLLLSTVVAEEKPCTIHDKGRYYDLNPLQSSKDYQVISTGGDLFPINVCQSVKTETFGVKDDIKSADIASFVRGGHGDFVIGKVNTTLGIYDNRPRLLLSDGSRCKSAGDTALEIHASTLIDFVCDTSVFGPGQPRLVARLPPGDDNLACAFFIEWKTHFACPTGESGGAWGVFAIFAVIFLVILMAYTALGTLYNRYVLQLRGFDQIPQFSVESMTYHGREAYDWIKDIVAGIGGNRSGGPTLGGLGSARTPNPFSHHAQAGGLEANDEFDSTGDFIRPQSTFIRPAPPRRTDTNPVSHQTQVINAESQRAQSLSYPNPTLAPPQKVSPPVRTTLEIRQATKEEREFMLGDDDYEDDDGEELDFVKPIPSSLDDQRPGLPTRYSPPPSGNSSSPNPSSSATNSAGGPSTPPGKESSEGKPNQS